MELEERLSAAVRHFWEVRGKQHRSQGALTGAKDYGFRAAVTGGKHLDGFIALLAELLEEAGLPSASIHTKATTLPGFFRPTKDWDVVVVIDGELLAIIEFKAQVGSFGNNYNNRVEEALGNATDLLAAYREGKFRPSQKPWLGWLMLLEDAPGARCPVAVKEPHFPVFPDFKRTSYAQRYELFCERLIRERLYDSTCFLLSNEEQGLEGGYSEPNPEIGFRAFATSLTAHAMAYAKMRK